MKKILIILVLLLATGCNKYNSYTELNYEQLNTKLENKDSFVLVLGSATCSACQTYKVTMERLIKEKQKEVFYIDIHKLSEEDNAKVYSKFVVQSTPTTLFIVEGKEKTSYDRIVGASPYDEVKKSLEKYGY